MAVIIAGVVLGDMAGGTASTGWLSFVVEEAAGAAGAQLLFLKLADEKVYNTPLRKAVTPSWANNFQYTPPPGPTNVTDGRA